MQETSLQWLLLNGLSWLYFLLASYQLLPSSGAFQSHSKTSVVLINQMVWCHQPPSINLLVISFLGSLMSILNNGPKSLELSPSSPQCFSPCQEMLDTHNLASSFCISLKFININSFFKVREESLGMCVGWGCICMCKRGREHGEGEPERNRHKREPQGKIMKNFP